jgi:hypothetical protein
MLAPFRENPFREKRLAFDFGESPGATRYEQWPSHVGQWQKAGKKAVDFIYPHEASRNLFFTEIKDYTTITRSGRAGQGTYSEGLAEMVTWKVKDSIAGFRLAAQSEDADERSFHASFQDFAYRVVFHWEFKRSVKQPYRKIQMKRMKTKLRELLHGVCTHVAVENVGDFPSAHWAVRRIGRKQS